jgi:hypothetical protein
MTEYYVNNIIGSDSNGGTSEAQAWAGITCWLDQTKGFTGGDSLWIKGTTMMYDIGRGNWGTGTDTKYSFSTTTTYFPRIYVQGYSSVTGDNCVGGLKPTLTRNVGDGVGNQYGNWDLMQGGYATFANLHFWANLSGTSWQYAVAMRGYRSNIYRNISIHVGVTYSGTMCCPLVGSDSTNTGYWLPIDAIHITSVPGLAFNSGANMAFGQGRMSVRGAIVDASNITQNDLALDGDSNFDYDAFVRDGNLYIGNLGTDQIGISLVCTANPYGIRIEKCVFVGLGTGIEFTTALGDLGQYWDRYNLVVKDCIFINCGIGIDFDNTTLADWKRHIEVVDCKFYNCTTNMINGTAGPFNNKAITENPWDSVNKKLNKYGKSLLTTPYKTILDVNNGGPTGMIDGTGRDSNSISGSLNDILPTIITTF